MARPTSSRPAQPDPEAELSEAARAVVHDAGDPRIDAHLAALGLGPDPAPTSARRTRASAADAELAALRERIAVLELEQTALITRTNVLAALLAFAILVVVALVALLLL